MTPFIRFKKFITIVEKIVFDSKSYKASIHIEYYRQCSHQLVIAINRKLESSESTSKRIFKIAGFCVVEAV